MQTLQSLKTSYFIQKILRIIGNNIYTNYTPLTVRSSPYTSSPTAASNIVLRISFVGFETVSLLKSTTRIWKLIQCGPKSWYSTSHKTHQLSYKNHLVNLYRNNWHTVRIMKSTQIDCMCKMQSLFNITDNITLINRNKLHSSDIQNRHLCCNILGSWTTYNVFALRGLHKSFLTC